LRQRSTDVCITGIPLAEVDAVAPRSVVYRCIALTASETNPRQCAASGMSAAW
jgi:hypothetical protein